MMSQEQKENTQALQERFPDVYQDFFSSHQIVVSADFSYSMVAGLSWRVGAPNIRHKLPFRTYIGIKPNGKPGVVEFEKSLVFSIALGKFVESEYLSSVYGELAPQAITGMLKERDGIENFTGFSFTILAEREENLGFDSSLSLLFTAGSLLFLDLIDTKTLDEFRTANCDELFAQETELSKKFLSFHTDLLKCGARNSHGVISGVTSFSSLVDSPTPVVYLTEPRNGSVEKKYRHLKPLDVSGDYSILDDFMRQGYRLHEMADVSGAFPLDVVSIYPGSSRGYISATKYVRDSLTPSFDKLRDITNKLFYRVINKTENKQRLPGFLQDTDEDGVYLQKYLDGQVYVRLHFLDALINLYKNALSSVAINAFLESINSFVGINAPFEESPSRNMQFIMRKIRKRAEERGIQIGIRALYWGKYDGNIFIFSPPSRFRQDIQEIVVELQRDYNPNIHLDYASWRDGWGGKGLRVEQDVTHEVLSPLVPAGSSKFLTWDGTELHEKLEDAHGINHEDFDVLFDQINNEVYVKGQKFSSKELPTKKATIEFFNFLAGHIGEIMLNDKLPQSSYASYRNELQGKVIGPISKLVREHTGKNLGITLSGDLRRFAVQFNPQDIKIGFVESFHK